MKKDDRTEPEKQFINKIEKLPKDTQDYIKGLLKELSQCYEYMYGKEGMNIVIGYFDNKKREYEHFYELLNESWFYKTNKQLDELKRIKKKKK